MHWETHDTNIFRFQNTVKILDLIYKLSHYKVCNVRSKYFFYLAKITTTKWLDWLADTNLLTAISLVTYHLYLRQQKGHANKSIESLYVKTLTLTKPIKNVKKHLHFLSKISPKILEVRLQRVFRDIVFILQ